MDIRRLWSLMPPNLQHHWLCGSVGPVHLATMAAVALEAGGQQPHLLDLGIDLVVAAWLASPLDGGLAVHVDALAQRAPGTVDPGIAQLARGIAGAWHPPHGDSRLARLLQRWDTSALIDLVEERMGQDPENLFWAHQAVTVGMAEGLWEVVERVAGRLEGNWPVLCHAVRATLALVQGAAASALAHLPLWPGAIARLAEAMVRTQVHGLEAARPAWRQVLQEAPWMLQAGLLLYDQLHNIHAERQEPPCPGVVALYTWDKPEELATTLESLHTSRLHGAVLWVLDNGCSAPAKDVLRHWQEQLGVRLRVISLPINVGAPAARNWLRVEAFAAGVPWMVYLDDDVSLPEDWLERLWAARMRYPEAGVWGCRVVDAVAPWTLQSVDLHLLPSTDPQQRFRVSDLHHQVLDWGQFAYVRPCASVTGCCHLFTAQGLREHGEFDLRYSPSQYDDLDRDVRMLQSGKAAVYQGHLEIRHFRRTGRAAMVSPAQFGNAAANMDKLQRRFSQSQWQEVMAREAQILAEDWWPKWTQVRAWLEEGRHGAR